jgi:uroporphyrin-III C-methyltransferase
LSARLALLARDDDTYSTDLKAAQDWLADYFDTKAKPVLNAQTNLRQLAENRLSISVPDINESLNALRTLQAVREKGNAR